MNGKKIFVAASLAIALSAVAMAQPKVMSHRGFYKAPGSYENTIHSLNGAQRLGVEGIELDVHLTSDDSLLILHGPKIPGTEKNIQQISFAEARSVKLPEGHTIPSLYEYFTEAKKTPALTLFLELKAHPTTARETQLVEKVLALCDKMDMYGQTVFISFSFHICDEVLRLHPGARVAPITSSDSVMRPVDLKAKGYWGISYYFKTLMNQAWMLDKAHEYGLKTILWPVNSHELVDMAFGHNVDWVSSDYPDRMQNLLAAIEDLDDWSGELKKAHMRDSKKLICFDLDGTLTQHKTQLTPENKAVLDTLMKRYEVIMVGAGNCPRIYHQMNDYPITIVGNYGMQESHIVDGQFVITREDTAPADTAFFVKNCNYLRKKYGYKKYKGDPIEFHQSGMVTFGLLGTKADKADKLAFDPDRAKRRVMYPEVLEIFKDYAVYIGGSSSFDFAPKQYNKYDACVRYAFDHGYTVDEVLFVGDDFADGGGDSHIRLRGMDYIEVTDYEKLPDLMRFMY